MHPLFPQAQELTGPTIAAAIEVHRYFGPGLIESIYEWALRHELKLRGYQTESQQSLKIKYKDIFRTEELRFDILVDKALLVEVKAVETVIPIHKTITLSYMK
ncbi:MAG: GxxExxY protein [Pirellulales bacterium]|nr:GxxExxY protein [Pirellulales bacterium]